MKIRIYAAPAVKGLRVNVGPESSNLDQDQTNTGYRAYWVFTYKTTYSKSNEFCYYIFQAEKLSWDQPGFTLLKATP